MTHPDHYGDGALHHGIARQLATMKGYLDELRPAACRALEALDRWHDVELTYTSNALEGSLLTRVETAAVLEHGRTTGARLLRDYLAAVDHREALGYVRALAASAIPIGETDILRLHQLTLGGIGREGAGRNGSGQRQVAGPLAALAGPTELPAPMGGFVRWLRAVPATPEAAFEAHWRFVAIQPFDDGNGRTGRLLMNLLLLRGSYPPVLIGPDERAAYLDGIERRSEGDAGPYMTFMATRLFNSLLHALDVACGEAQAHKPASPAMEAGFLETALDDPDNSHGSGSPEALAGQGLPPRTPAKPSQALHQDGPGPGGRPDIIVAGASPLIHLAQADALHLLHRIGGAVIVMDLVASEVTRGPGLRDAEALRTWLDAGAQPGSDAPVRVEATEAGRLVALARAADPGFRMRDGGGNATMEWLAARVRSADPATIVLHGDSRVPGVVAAAAGDDADLDLLSTQAFLEVAERRQLILSAADVWRRIDGPAPAASPPRSPAPDDPRLPLDAAAMEPDPDAVPPAPTRDASAAEAPEPAAPAALPPRSPVVGFRVDLPDYLDRELGIRAVTGRVTKCFLILQALAAAGYAVRPEDLVPGRRRKPQAGARTEDPGTGLL